MKLYSLTNVVDGLGLELSLWTHTDVDFSAIGSRKTLEFWLPLLPKYAGYSCHLLDYRQLPWLLKYSAVAEAVF